MKKDIPHTTIINGVGRTTYALALDFNSSDFSKKITIGRFKSKSKKWKN